MLKLIRIKCHENNFITFLEISVHFAPLQVHYTQSFNLVPEPLSGVKSRSFISQTQESFLLF